MSLLKVCMTFYFHATVAAMFLFTWAYSISYLHHVLPDMGTYGGPWKFLTYINLVLQSLYFSFCVFNDIVGTNCGPSKKFSPSVLQQVRDTALASVIFPIGVFVVLLFWGIYFVDKDLIYPDHIAAIFPSWVNHVQHTVILPVLLLEKFIIYHHYPSWSRGLLLCVLAALAYQLWIFWIAHFGGFWVYPVLAVMDTFGRAMFLVVLWIILIILYAIGYNYTTAIWGVMNKTTSSSSKKKQ